jgi:hypothetical protein
VFSLACALLRTPAFSHFEFELRYAELRRFAAKISQTVEDAREKNLR